MRRLLASLMLILFFCLPVLAEEAEDPLKTEGCDLVTAGIAALAQEQTGWKKVMMEHTTVTSVKRSKEYVTVTVTIPAMQSGVSEKTKINDDPAGYLTQALEPLTSLTDTRDFAIRIPIKGSGDKARLDWTGEKNLSNYKKKINSMATTAATSFETTKVKTAVGSILLPKAATMPTNHPSTAPEMADLSSYTAAVADALGLTVDQANARLPYLLMLMQVSKISADDGMDDLLLTVKAGDWAAMLSAADAAAREAMPNMMGVPEMTRDEIEAIFLSQVDQVWMDTYYSTKKAETVELRVDLPTVLQAGVQTADALVAYMAQYSAAIDSYIDDLMTYGATLDYYPQVPIIDTAVLSGENAEDGARIYFVAGKENHGYVCIRQQNETVLSGFIHSGTRLMTVLEPGSYQVYCSYGPTWYGNQYAFGRECFCGVFELEITDSITNWRITLEENGGALDVTPMAYSDFAAVISQ